MKKHLTFYLKWTWIAAVIIFIALLFQKKHVEFINAVQQISAGYLILSFIFIFAAKSLLPLFMRYVLCSINKNLSLLTCFKIYNISQLGKYLPGNFWHFVGKAVAYKNQGFSLGNIRDALVIENVWLVFSAFAYGLAVVLVFEFELIKNFFISYGYFIIFFIILIPFLFIFAKKLFKINFQAIFSDYRLIVKILIVQMGVWTLLGLGFAVLIIPFLPQETSTFLSIIGFYAIAYSVGFITPFAPAGIGVREGIMVLCLLPVASMEVVLTVSVANRVVYLLVEIILAVFSNCFVTRTFKKKYIIEN